MRASPDALQPPCSPPPRAGGGRPAAAHQPGGAGRPPGGSGAQPQARQAGGGAERGDDPGGRPHACEGAGGRGCHTVAWTSGRAWLCGLALMLGNGSLFGRMQAASQCWSGQRCTPAKDTADGQRRRPPGPPPPLCRRVATCWCACCRCQRAAPPATPSTWRAAPPAPTSPRSASPSSGEAGGCPPLLLPGASSGPRPVVRVSAVASGEVPGGCEPRPRVSACRWAAWGWPRLVVQQGKQLWPRGPPLRGRALSPSACD